VDNTSAWHDVDTNARGELDEFVTRRLIRQSWQWEEPRGQDWANAAIAIWMFISPWLLVLPAAQIGMISADTWITAIVVFLVSVWAIAQPEKPQLEWVTGAAALWLVLSSAILGLGIENTSSLLCMVSDWFCGIVIFGLSMFAWLHARRRRALADETNDGAYLLSGEMPRV